MDDNELDEGMDDEVESVTTDEPRKNPLPKPDGDGGIEGAEGAEDQKPEPKTEAAKDGELAPETATWAKDLGFSDEDLDGFTTEQVKRMCAVEERRMKAGVTSEQKTGEAEAAPKTETPKAEAPKKFQRLEFPKEVREKFDPEVVGLLDQVNNHYAEHVESLMKRLDERDAADAQRQQFETFSHTARTIESSISKLGKEYEPIFGTGAARGLKDGSTELTNRQKVLDEVLLLKDAYARAGRKVSDDVLVQRAIDGLFSKPAAQSARNNLQNAIRDRAGRIVAVPTQRKLPERAPATTQQRESKAKANLEKKLQALGVSE